MMGWSVMFNLIGVMLVYFYLPPEGKGLNMLISQVAIFGAFNLMAIITASGRLIDAFYDPFIGRKSDTTKNKRGRRIPFMLYSIIPSVFFCILIFFPPLYAVSAVNAVWLIVVLSLFFVATTTYIIPYNALLPELATTNKQRVRLSSYQQAGFVIGIVISSFTNNLADLFQHALHLSARTVAVQYAVIIMAIIAGILMLVPVLAINEKDYSHSVPSTMPLMKALKESLKNRNFIYFLIAYFSYFMSLNLITNGLMYDVTVLANLPESYGFRFMGFMVLLSLCFYPLVNFIVRKTGEKKLMIIAFFILALAFTGVSSVGRLPIDPMVQLFILLAIAAFPAAALGILPNAILADIVDDDVKQTGDSKEGTYFAVNYFAAKLGQTFGIALFAALTIYGKDPGHDLGLRLTGICGFVLCLMAGIAFTGFKEKKRP
ncbi:MAG TPA: MFS transporter [Bacteroidia bacterium]|nr:MFS transporter [Bacteroidia bacterium]